MLKTDAHAALAMFQVIISSQTKREMLEKAAEACLDASEVKTLKLLHKKSKPSFETRNDFAHGLWAVSNELPDALLLIPAGKYTNEWTKALPAMASKFAQLSDRSAIKVYTKKHLQDEAQRASIVHSQFYRFYNYIELGRSSDDEWLARGLAGPGPAELIKKDYAKLSEELGSTDVC